MKSKKLITIVLLIFLSTNYSFSQDFKRIFRYLKKDKLEEAIMEIKKTNSSNRYTPFEASLSAVAVAVIKNNKTNTQYNPYKSLEFIKKFKVLNLNEKDINKFLKKYGYSLESIEKDIYLNILNDAKNGNTELSYQKALKTCVQDIRGNKCFFYDEVKILQENTAYFEANKKYSIDGFKYFIKNYDTSKYYDEAYKTLVELEFKQAKRRLWVYDLDRFIKDYRPNEFTSEAIYIRDSIKFFKTPKTHDSYQSYITLNPNSKYVIQAKKELPNLLFEEVKNKGDIKKSKLFLSKFPKDTRAKIILDLIASKTIKDKDISLLEKFLVDFPNYNKINTVEKAIEDIYYENLYNFPTESEFIKFKKRFPNNPNILLISKRLISLTNTKNGEHLELYPSGKIRKTGFFKNGERHGEWKWYYESGKLWSTKSYIRGHEDGVAIGYSESGEVIHREVFKYEQPDFFSTNKKKVKKYSDDGQRCSRCKMGRYYDGGCDMCGSASPSRLREHKSKMPKCKLCSGIGIEVGSLGESRICPVCKGKGYQSY